MERLGVGTSPYMGGQYCICNDGWMGVDCSTSYDYRVTPNPPAGFKAGGGLVEDLVRQMSHTILDGLQLTGDHTPPASIS